MTEEIVFKYPSSGKKKLTLRLMPGHNPKWDLGRFRRDQKESYLRPSFLSTEINWEGKRELDEDGEYSDIDFFTASTDLWHDKLCEVPYLTKIKKLELIRKSGEVVNITNKTDLKRTPILCNPKKDPFVEIRVY